ncbi:caspase domain-containing protein [Armillaria luteobubalina]|uniref:Caspase domain-containing protein n=1 Tax=Armillaria luteobubalina TaxID=153913 RepID=A0AA39P1M4_9AGAR|nr:caspase domain-containing protein [Armillaria luteobubalina]
MTEIVCLALNVLNLGKWISPQKTAPDLPNFPLLDDDKVHHVRDQREKWLIEDEKEYATIPELEAAPTKEGRIGYNVSQRMYRCIFDKIRYHISVQYTYGVNPPPLPVENNSSVNTKPLQSANHPRFWAVLIGIDGYQSTPLRGCVSDALLMEKYLKEEIGVPQERIQLLVGSQDTSSEDPSFPSRTNIVETLLSLVDNPQIEVGDNIIIYFSGHGSGYLPNEYYISDDEDSRILGGLDDSVEAICPIDRDTIDNSGLRVPDISDREINSIFQQISRSKGHRITFFLDACHSGTHVRCFPEPGTRTVPPLPRASLRRMLNMADENLSRYPSYKSILASDWKPDMSSHVILAACKEYQTARETEGETGYNGIFTRAVIDALRSGNLSEESTYIDLLYSLSLRGWQNPVVAGKNKSDRLWYKH